VLADLGQWTSWEYEGLLIAGGYNDVEIHSVELWSPPPSDFSCRLPDLPRTVEAGATVDLVNDKILVCCNTECHQLVTGGWRSVQSTQERRRWHSSTVIEEKMLLVGGGGSSSTTRDTFCVADSTCTTTEWVDGVSSKKGFTLSPGRENHCSVLMAEQVLVVTGGWNTETLVEQFSGLTSGTVTSTVLPSLNTGRSQHGCAVYGEPGKQTIIVAGGLTASNAFTDSVELYNFSPDSRGSWETVTPLPSPRGAVRGAKVGATVVMTGGWTSTDFDTDEILAWDPDTAAWTEHGKMTDARYYHAVAEVNLASVKQFCV